MTTEQWTIFIGVSQSIIFVLQLVVFGYQAWKLQETVKAAADQSGDMKNSIRQATRAADAMEKSAGAATIASQAATESVATIKETMTRQQRAYLCINFGSAIFQKRETGFRFEVRLILVNFGLTPGYKVSYKARASVLPFPLPDDFDFSLPDTPTTSESTLGGFGQQQLILSAFVDRIYSEEEEAEIKAGSTKRLYMFGTANYQDVYHISRYTNFCLSVVWLNDGNAMGFYTRRHNDAD
jgi:Sec-independent protein translocase protein TatA